MAVATTLAIAALVSMVSVVTACLRSKRNEIGYLMPLAVLGIAYVMVSSVAPVKDNVDGIVFVSTSTLALSSALCLGSLWSPIRPVTYAACIMASRITPRDSKDYEEDLALRRQTRWYFLASVCLFPAFFFAFYPLFASLAGVSA